MKLRSYQTETLEAIAKHWMDGDRAAVILPTGAGKTVIFSELARMLEQSTRNRTLILVHREELVTQTVAKLQGMGVRDIGVVKGNQNQVAARTIVATVQTLYHDRRLAMLLEMGPIYRVICDELHHFASARNKTLLSKLGVFDGRCKAVGFTATFVRGDSAKLGNDWDVVYERDVQWGIEHGYLSDVEAHSIRVPDLDLSTVRSTAGDFADQSLGDAMSSSSARDVIPVAWRKYADGRPSILFAPTVSSCGDLADGLRDAGIKTEVVFGTTPTAERQATYDRIRNGITQVLASVGVLTEGFDIPAISCAILARPTKSRGLWQQMAGRALRLFPGKDKAILLDITGDALNHSLASVTDLARTSQETESKKTAPALCACSESPVAQCCSVGETRLECKKNQVQGRCFCRCLCELDFDDTAIELVRGEHDVEVDLFAGSTSVWLQTYRGIWFVPTYSRIFFIGRRPDVGDGGYWIGCSGTSSSMNGGYWASKLPLDMTMAMALAQEQAETEDPTIARRDSKWRRAKAQETQLLKAAGLGIPVERGMRKGPVSDAISQYYASRMLDTKIGHFIEP